MSDDLKVVQRYNSDVEAEMARGLLEGAGVPAMVAADDCGGMYPQFRQQSKGVRLLVAADRLEEARRILDLTGDEEGDAG